MGLSDNLNSQAVSELELRELLTAPPSQTVRQTVQQMQQHRLGCVVIVDGAGRPVGKFTERRLIKLLRQGAAALDEPVEKHMSKWLVRVNANDSILMAIDALQAGDQRFVCVVDNDGRAIALTGQKGVMEFIADHFPRQVKVQRMRSKLYMDEREGG